MTKITTGLASAGLVALAFGVVAPGTASATPAPSPSPASTTPGTAASSAQATAPGHISEIRLLGDRQIVLNGVAHGALVVQVEVPDGTGGLAPVISGRFSLPLDRSDLGKQAVLRTFGPEGPTRPVPFVVELKEHDGSTVNPTAPVVHAVSQYDDDSFVIEGTVAYDPLAFDRIDVIAHVGDRQVRSALDDNGTFALEIPAEHLGHEVRLVSWRGGLPSTSTYVEGTPTTGNDASESFPLDIASPTADAVVTDGAVTFEGSAIPNSTIAVTRDDEANRTSATLCETRVAADGDWSCTSPTLPGGDYATTVTETPTWPSAAPQSAGTAFRVAAAENGQTPGLPRLSSVTRDADGDLVVRVIANRAGEARLVVGDHERTTRGVNGRFTFTLDGALAGQTAIVTGLAGSTEGRSLDLPLVPVGAPAPSPLQAPVVHAVTQQADRFVVEGTTSYSPTEFDVPGVLVQVDGSFVTVAAAVHDGAFVANVPLALAGREIELRTTRGATLSERTPLTVAATDGNTAPATFPLEVTSPGDGEQVTIDTPIITGEGIPGSTVSVVGDGAQAAEVCASDVLPDGTWSCEVDAPLAHGEHTMTVSETPYWAALARIVSTRSFTVADDDGESPAPVAPVTVTNPADPTLGYARNQAFTFEGTGQPGSIITIENKFGTHLATATVTEEGTWSWTRSTMGTSIWHLHFIQDKGQATSTITKVLGFAPAAVTVAPVTVTNPADPTLGYARNQAFTFEGTGQPGSIITIENKFGTHLATATVTEEGTWSWTRSTMGTSIWHLHFIQDKGQATSTITSVLGFAPRS